MRMGEKIRKSGPVLKRVGDGRASKVMTNRTSERRWALQWLHPRFWTDEWFDIISFFKQKYFWMKNALQTIFWRKLLNSMFLRCHTWCVSKGYLYPTTELDKQLIWIYVHVIFPVHGIIIPLAVLCKHASAAGAVWEHPSFSMYQVVPNPHRSSMHYPPCE